MKKLLFSLILIPALTFSQEKKDTKIIVTLPDTTNVFNRLVNAIYENGYSMEEKDPAGFILTKEKQLSKISVYYKIRAFIKGNQIIFTTTMNIPLIDKNDKFTEVWYTKGDSFNRRAWDIVEKIAKQFGGLSYSK